MSGADPFKALADGLALAKPKPPPMTADDIYTDVFNKHADFFSAVEKFSEVLGAKGFSVHFRDSKTDEKNGIIYGDLLIRKGDKIIKGLPISFQGSAFWVDDVEFNRYALRDGNLRGCWKTDELSDFIDRFGKYLLIKVEANY